MNKSRSELEQVASTAQASHTATTLRTRGAVLLVSSLKVEILTDSPRACAWPQRKDSGHPTAFAIGSTTVDGKPKGPRDQLVPCTGSQWRTP